MDIDSDVLTGLFAENGRAADLVELRTSLSALKTRQVASSPVPYRGEPGAPERIRSYAVAYRQVLLHRALALLEGALIATLDDNPYLIVVAIRAFFETVAPLGYLLSRLESLKAGNLKADKVDEDLMIQILGTRDKGISTAMPAKQIMSLLRVPKTLT